MRGLLLFCRRDWLDSDAGPVEHYVHKVFSHVASHGVYVAWVCQHHRWLASRKARRPQLEILDGIQIARLGHPWLFGTMGGMLLRKIAEQPGIMSRLDVVVDCVQGQPFPVADYINLPVLPLIFSLSPKLRMEQNPPGPVIAANNVTRRRLLESCVAENFVVSVPPGVDTVLFSPSTSTQEQPAMLVMESPSSKTGLPQRVVQILQREGVCLPTMELGIGRTWFGRPTRHFADGIDRVDRSQLYRKASFAYCGTGSEHYALELMASGLPIVCPATETAAEYVDDGQTGLLFPAGNAEAAADCVRRLLGDETLQKRLSLRAREEAEKRSWEKAANRVLATLEIAAATK